MGFAYAYDSQNATHMRLGGDFRPVVWPGESTQRLTHTVILMGQPIQFCAQLFVTSGGPDPRAVMSAFGLDDGEQEALARVDALNVNNTGWPYEVGAFQSTTFGTFDCTKFFVKTGWVLNRGGVPGNVVMARRMLVVDGDTAIWTDAKGLTRYRSIWGDDVSIQENNLTSNQFPPSELDGSYKGGSIVIKNERHSSHTITMAVSKDKLKVTNTLGLPEATLTGWTLYHQRRNRDTNWLEPLFDFGFIPLSMDITSGSTTLTTSFGWSWSFDSPEFGWTMQYYPPLLSITHANDMVETFTYQNMPPFYKNLADWGFSSVTGEWKGFNTNPSYPVWTSSAPILESIKQEKTGQGSLTRIERVLPAWDLMSWTWTQKDHSTTVRSFNNPEGTGNSRKVQLKHLSFIGPTGSAWGDAAAPDAEQMSAYLFATSAVVQADLVDESGQTYKTIKYGNWSAKSYSNPSGQIFFSPGTGITSLPVSPKPTQIIIQQPNMPTVVKTSRDWDHFYHKDQRVGLITSAVNPPGPVFTSGYSYPNLTSFDDLPHDVHIKTQKSMVMTNRFQVVPVSESRTLEGPSLPSLVVGGGLSMPARDIQYSYDDMDRVTQVIRTAGTSNSPANGTMQVEERREYVGSNPNPAVVREKTYEVGAGYLPYAESVGIRYAYDSGPFYWLLSETNLLTGQKTTYEVDDLGRVTSTKDPHGVTTTTSYDDWGRKDTVTRMAVTGVGSVTTAFTYDPKGAWSKETLTAEGRVLTTTTYYDAFGRTTRIVKPDGSSQETTYNGWGEKLTQTPWLKPGQTPYGVFHWSYDAKGRVTSQKDPKDRLLFTALQEPAWNASEGGGGHHDGG